MAVMTGVVGALSAFYHDAMDFSDAEHRNVSFNRLVAKLPTIVAMAYKYNTGMPFMYPDNDLDYTANFMRMMFGNPCEKYVPNPVLVRPRHHLHPARRPRAERLHLHGASGGLLRCQPVRLYRRRHRLPVGPGSRWRERSLPQHAGGNRRRFPRRRIHQAREGQERLLQADGLRSPRLQELRPARQADGQGLCDVLGELGLENDRLFKLAKELEKIALEDDYFVEKKLYPNVDFYSGIVQKALGIPTEMFTCIFALARTVGWMTQWEEMITDPEYKIGRPRQLYVGAARRDVVPLAQRG